jgi:hypothetical protein
VKKILLSLMVVAILVLGMALPAIASSTTADVTVTATPAYISITDNQTDIDFGVVAESATPYTATNWCAITNISTIQTDIKIAVTASTWTGGTPWTHSDTASQGADIVGLKANKGGTWGVGDVTVKYSDPDYIYENCPASTNFTYGLKLYAPSSFSDGEIKSNTARLTAAAG